MKRLVCLMAIMVLLAVSPLWAAFCHNCGKELPQAANFCPGCGKASAGAFETARPEPVAPQPAAIPIQVNVTAYPPQNTPVIINDISLADYESVNQMEMLLTGSNFDAANRQAAALRIIHNDRMSRLSSRYAGFSLYQRKLHDLHLQKFKALEYYLEAWRSEEKGFDRVRAQAEKDKALFMLSQVNEAIDTLLTGGATLTSINQVEEIEKRIHKNTANYVVTAPYLLVDNQRLNRGEPIWVIDVVSASAKVLHMGKGRLNEPICGWVSVYDLEKRSNWRSDPAFFFSQPTTIVYAPPPEPPVKIVVIGKKRYPYPYRHPRDRHDDRHDDRRDDRHDRYDDKHDKGRGDKHKNHDFVIIKPRFW